MDETTRERSSVAASRRAVEAAVRRACSPGSRVEVDEAVGAVAASTRQLGCSDDDEIGQACRADDAEDG